MTPPSIPPNAYTHAPEQHPNLIVGSLQLLFWLVFRPLAWKHHIQRLDPSLDKNFSLIRLLTHQRWRRWQTWRFLIQAFLLLPILTSLIAGLISLSLGVSPERVALGMALGVALGVVCSVSVNESYSMESYHLLEDDGIFIGLWMSWGRTVPMSALFIPWHFLLYQLDQSRAGKFPSLLHRHLAFWDEWQYLPIWGLDKHLLLVLERSPVEG